MFNLIVLVISILYRFYNWPYNFWQRIGINGTNIWRFRCFLVYKKIGMIVYYCFVKTIFWTIGGLHPEWWEVGGANVARLRWPFLSLVLVTTNPGPRRSSSSRVSLVQVYVLYLTLVWMGQSDELKEGSGVWGGVGDDKLYIIWSK